MESLWQRFEPSGWEDYELIDSGDGEKLERFGEVTVIRPEVTAIWPKRLLSRDWKKLADAKFVQDGPRSGRWEKFKPLPSAWKVQCPMPGGKITFNLKFTRFKHLGVFPEQAANWSFIQDQIRQQQGPVKVLNLFAYTGGASLAAKAAGAEVTHVDSIRQVVDWTRENMESSGLDGIRWVVEDALRFVEREAKRGNKYHGVIMDPPSWGIAPGKKQKKWKLEDQLCDLLQKTSLLLEDSFFLVLNTYSGLPNSTLETLITTWFRPEIVATGDLILRSEQGQLLTTGSCLRCWKN